MKKRYQVISIEKGKRTGKHTHFYRVLIHDRNGIDGIFSTLFCSKSKKRVISMLRSDGMEVSRHVENGGSLRLV